MNGKPPFEDRYMHREHDDIEPDLPPPLLHWLGWTLVVVIVLSAAVIFWVL